MESRRVYGLDILRAYSIFTVVYAHGYDLVQQHVNVATYMLPATDGVTLFFVLSGFLIGNIILRHVEEGKTSFPDLMNFWRRRWLRTIPNYVLVLTVLVATALGVGVPLPDKIPLYYLFLQNFTTPHPAFFSEAWSLAVEEWFYLLFPLGLFCALRFARTLPAEVVLIGAFIFLPALLRLWRVETMDPRDLATWVGTVKFQVLTRLDSIIYGVLAALLLRRFSAIRAGWRRGLFAAGISLFLFDKAQLYIVAAPNYAYHFTLWVETIAAALLLPQLVSIRTGSGPTFRLVTFTSKISYAIYLAHLSIVLLILVPAIAQYANLGMDGADSLAKYVVYWALAFGLATIIYRFYEQPILRLRDRFWPG